MGCLKGGRRAAALEMKEDAEAEALQAEDDYHQDLMEPWSQWTSLVIPSLSGLIYGPANSRP